MPVKTTINRLLGVEIGENDCFKNNLIQFIPKFLLEYIIIVYIVALLCFSVFYTKDSLSDVLIFISFLSLSFVRILPAVNNFMKCFQDFNFYSTSTEVLKNAFTYATNFDAQIIQVPISDLDQGGVMNESEMSMRLGLPGMISIAETIALERELRIAKHTGTKYHSMCISTKESLNAIMHYKNLIAISY